MPCEYDTISEKDVIDTLTNFSNGTTSLGVKCSSDDMDKMLEFASELTGKSIDYLVNYMNN